MKNYIKGRIKEAFGLELLENLVDEDYPSTFDMEHFKTLSKFTERVAYCNEHLKKISSGSARIVYIVDDTKVLKLAKNQKGVAQCEVEIQWGQERYFSDILARTIDNHPDGLWVEMELARKVKKSDFQRLEGINFDEFSRYLRNFEQQNKGQRPIFGIDPVEKEKLNESQFVNNVIDFMNNADALAGDFGRTNSYGLVKRDGHETIVIIDFGLTSDVYSTYYDFNRNK